MLGLSGKAVRNLARVLWALNQTGWNRRGIEEQLNVEEKTAKKLLGGSGLGLEPSDRQFTVQEVLDAQRFIPQRSPVLRWLRALLTADTSLE